MSDKGRLDKDRQLRELNRAYSLIGSNSVSSANNLDVSANVNVPFEGLNRYILFVRVYFSANDTLAMRGSTDGGSNFVSTNNYSYAADIDDFGGGTGKNTANNGEAQWLLTPIDVVGDSAVPISMWVYLFNWDDGNSRHPSFTIGQGTLQDPNHATGRMSRYRGSGGSFENVAEFDGLRLFPSGSANINGEARLYKTK